MSPIPLWVTVALGILTLVGTLAGAWGGQWIATRRDDRRWEREAAREDLRWRREQERLRQQRHHDMRLRWAEHRLHAYVECYRLATSWLRLLSGPAPSSIWDRLVHIPKAINPNVEAINEEDLVDVAAKYHAHLTLIAVVASQDANTKAAKVYEVFSGANSIVSVAKAMKDTNLPDGDIAGFLRLIYDLRAAFQNDLAVNDAEFDEIEFETP